MSKRIGRKILTLMLSMVITVNPIFASNNNDEFISLIDKYSISSSMIYPTENLNVDIKINKRRGVEQYTFYNKIDGTSGTYTLKDGQVISYVSRENDLLDVYDILYKSGSSVIHPDLDEVYFSKVSLYDDVIHIHQSKTGKYSMSNCAPSSIAMAYNWANGLIGEDALTVEEIREKYPSVGQLAGEDVTGYDIYSKNKIYKELGVEHKLSGFYCDARILLKEINQGKLLNLTVNTEQLPMGDRLSRIDKPYSGGGPHSLLCTGYLYVCIPRDDGTDWERIFLEIVDPAIDSEELRYFELESFNKMLDCNSFRYISITYTGDVDMDDDSEEDDDNDDSRSYRKSSSRHADDKEDVNEDTYSSKVNFYD